ncbi:MAG: hypothetical protein EXR93_12260 [Gemmatimonadetes bacterium]|nr:hypothetical protein [Gemmatimonadota bacterium]
MGKHAGLVTRVFYKLLAAAAVLSLSIPISWALASNAVAGLLGSPPPEMGKQQTTFLWDGAAAVKGRPKAWRFTYTGTHIPATPTVRFYVSPLGKVLRAEPPDVALRIKIWHQKGFN